ncbi:cell wall metabolism sensor histidine kinase WalK [Microbacterium sp. SORGH_AS_0888]|uniref:sensor histidine kinase n=1 Tax=Microbacterium sp. SORGH_AS_0888 TaxID=3041791 RepID=UPI00278391D0|nr:HAMP domain-containing sensor histidine kinase [Microbacterium sp. SORGH_AS_0888]MDQ1128123.1 two-component system OmpR family sensor kinase [Microbacterium sp. SORGH_AS_0888]
MTRIVSGFLPLQNEAVAGIVDGRPVAYPSAGSDFTAIFDPALVTAAVNAAQGAHEPVLGTVDTRAGVVRFVAQPLGVPGDPAQGIYLRAVGMDEELAPLYASILTFALSGLVVLTVLGVAGWFVTGRLLSPLQRLREAADAVTFDDLGARVPETGDDEFADLSRTMNSMLERLELSVDSQRQLLDDIRHELKTPITIVRGHLEMMDVADPVDVAGTRDIGIAELDRLTRLVEDIDLLSSAQDDQFSMRPIDLSVLTEHVGELVAAIPGHPFTVTRRGRGVLVGDSDRLTQAWLQLAENAAKYTPPGSPVEIGSECDGDEARLWVQDHGPGIPPAARRRIFHRFDRADTHRSVGGSGLGLAIVDAIAKAHAGVCTVTDTPGGGATFTIRIPIGRHPDTLVPTPVRAGDVVLQREATT